MHFARRFVTTKHFMCQDFSDFGLIIQIEPSLISSVQFQWPKRGRDVGVSSERPPKKSTICPQTDEAKEAFMAGLKKVMPTAVVFTSVAPLERLATRSLVVRKLPPPLTLLQKPKYASMSEGELREACRNVLDYALKITSEESIYLEESTRLQSQSPLWYEHRTGRITASKFKRVKQASIVNPPASLVKELMQVSRFDSSKVPALHWGITNEDTARKAYLESAQEQHSHLEYFDSGLHINPSFLHLGATPDGIINCDCCGRGLIEIKCPFKHREKHPHEITDPNFYLKQHEDGEIHLRDDHEYYYQIQGQLAVCNIEYCDFICWTPCGMHCERILSDPKHFFDITKPALDEFFIAVLLPRLLTGSPPHCGETCNPKPCS